MKLPRTWKLLGLPAAAGMALSLIVAGPAGAATPEATQPSSDKSSQQQGSDFLNSPSVNLKSAPQITQSDLQNEGYHVALTSDPSNAGVTISGKFIDSAGTAFKSPTTLTTDAKGNVDGYMKASGKLAPGTATLKMTASNGATVPDETFTVTEDETTPPPEQNYDDAAITAAPTTFTEGSWGDGITVNGTDFKPNSEVRVEVNYAATGHGDELASVTAKTDADGNFTQTVSPKGTPEVPKDDWSYSVSALQTAESGDVIASDVITLTINEKQEPAADPSISIADTTFTEGSWGEGIKVSGKNFEPNQSATVQVVHDADSSGTVIEEVDVKADADGTFTETVKPSAAPKVVKGKKYFVGASWATKSGAQAGGSVSTAAVPMAEAAPAAQSTDWIELTISPKATVNPTISVSPKKISTTDFENEDKGVTITGKHYAPGEAVTLEASSQSGKVDGITLHSTSDKNGTVQFTLYAIGSAVADTYNVTLTGDDHAKTLKASFQVYTGAANGGGDDDNAGGSNAGNSNGGNNDGADPGSDSGNAANDDPVTVSTSADDLPRTGGLDFGALYAGAGLVVLGAAGVLVTRRKKNSVIE